MTNTDQPVQRKATLTRQPSAPDGTFGTLFTDSGYQCVTAERPWADNAQNSSCILPSPGGPPVSYLCLFQWSPSHNANVYHLQGVDGHTQIEMHAANVIEELLGCICVGEEVAVFAASGIREGMPPTTHRGVTNSVATLAKFEASMRDAQGNQQPFTLTIQ
jgi:hypothetical protein